MKPLRRSAGPALVAGPTLRAAFARPACAVAATRAQPNVIFILADDLGYADIGPYGQKDIATPSLDRFAREVS